MTKTLILTRSEIENLVTPALLLDALREGFAAVTSSEGVKANRFPVVLPPPAPTWSSAMLLAPGYVPNIPAYTVKVHSKFPSDRQALKGIIVLHSIHDGSVLAMLESTWLTNLRTGLAGALGADTLARRDAKSVAIIGAGAQGRLQLECLLMVRKIETARVFDSDPERARHFAVNESKRLGLDISISNSVAEAVSDIDIVVSATWSREPFIHPGMIAKGTHLTTLGPDQPNKAEISADVIRQAVFVADDIDLACEMGAIAGVGLSRSDVHASLGEVLSGIKTGRTSDDQITVFGAVGLPFQDLVAAWAAYTAAKKTGAGSYVDLLG